jgi:hypothetical protein
VKKKRWPSRPFLRPQTLSRISEADPAKCDFVGIDEPSVMFAVKYFSS